MVFNGTLIVQIGNFVITYWLLKIIFLKKGYVVVSQENAEFDALHERIATYKQLAQEAMQKKEQAFNAYTTQVHTAKPNLTMQSYQSMHIIEKPLEPFKAPSQKTIKELAQHVMEKVVHD